MCVFPLSPFSYYLYQWPVTMSVIVVVSIFISLCTCSLVVWVREVLRDYDMQRRRRRRALHRQQPPGATITGTAAGSQPGGGGGRVGGVPRGTVVIPRPPHSVGVADLPPPPYPQGASASEDGLTTPTPSEVSAVEDMTTTSSQMGETTFHTSQTLVMHVITHMRYHARCGPCSSRVCNKVLHRSHVVLSHI